MPKILLVDDDELLTTMYKTRFEVENYTVLVAANGEEALDCLKKEHPDLVLLDIMLPRGGGLSILEEKSKDPTIKDIPVIVLSNLTNQTLADQLKQYYVKEFLMKVNFTPTQVVQAIKKYFPQTQAPTPSPTDPKTS